MIQWFILTTKALKTEMESQTQAEVAPKKEKTSILKGNLFQAVLKFSLPIILSLILQTLYGSIDLLMVGNFASEADFQAVSLGSQTVCIVIGVTVGLATGVSVLIAQGYGSKDNEKVKKVIGNSLYIFGGLALLAMIILMAASKGIAIGLETKPNALDATTKYILICGAGSIFIVTYNVLTAIFVGLGHSRTPLLIVFLSSVIHVILDAILIPVCHLGALGAALSTVFSEMCSVIFSFLFLRKMMPVKLSKNDFKYSNSMIKSILLIGFPIGLLRMVEEISYLIILGIGNSFTEIEAMGVEVAEKIVVFVMLIPMAFMSSISTFVAQNLGANQNKRANNSFKISLFYSALFGGIMAIILIFLGKYITMIFVGEDMPSRVKICEAAQTFLYATSVECFLLSFSYCFLGYFNGKKKTIFVLTQGLITTLIIKIPFAYLAQAKFPSLINVAISMPLAAGCSLIACLIYYIILRSKEHKKMKEETKKVAS